MHANTGVSDERVSLPDGPGSVGGVGESLSASGNMGGMSYEVPFELPEGHAGATPSLALQYSSLNGNEALGIGWDLYVPHIERFTLRGQPGYDLEDVFAADGSEELVRVQSDAGERVYRARFEGGFVRYHYRGDASGQAGYWVAEYPDGSKGYFGAYEDASGEPVEVPKSLARDSAGRVFRYMLVKTEDSFGHAVRYHYTFGARTVDGDTVRDTTPLLSRIEYLFKGDDPRSMEAPRYSVKLDYEARDDLLHSGLPGFALTLSQRLSQVEIWSNHGDDTLLRRYVAHYESAVAGTSRLVRVVQYGLGGEQRLHAGQSFTYSSSLDLACGDCDRPFVFDLGTLAPSGTGGVNFLHGHATLIDIDGNALPDLLSTQEGKHYFYLNQMQPDGSQAFLPPQASQLDTAGFELESAGVQVLDVLGDGFTDMISVLGHGVLCNDGRGDWTRQDCPDSPGLEGSLFHDDAGDADPKGIRFLDANGDRRIDVLQAGDGSSAQLWLAGEDGYARSDEADASLGRGFDSGSHLQLADLNGDGLLDLIDVSRERLVWARLHLGGGRFAPASDATLTWKDPADAARIEPEQWELQDLNGDGLDDLVAVVGRAVYFALNRAASFLPLVKLDDRDLGPGQSLPERRDDTTVLFADMNASGTQDVVWIDAKDQSVKALELFALRPNLLTRADNGLGGVQTVEYGSSAREQARDEAAGEPWDRQRLPQAMQVVTATEQWAELTPDVRLRIERRYHQGFYDGEEKRYRGFAKIEEEVAGDLTQQGSLRVSHYLLGKVRPEEAGRLEAQALFGFTDDGGRYPIQKALFRHERCPLAEAESFQDDYAFPVRHVCEVATTTTLQEGRPKSAWVTLKTERRYDGYGHVTLEANLGVVAGEGGACEPCAAPAGTVSGACGTQCLGDEQYVATEYIAPGEATAGSWNLGAAYRTRRYSRADADGQPADGAKVAETLLYYDGDEEKPFQGLAQGELVRGLVTRVCQRERADAKPNCGAQDQGAGWIESTRVTHDVHGNVVAELDPLGAAGDFSGHRRAIAYDAYGLRPEEITLYLSRDGQNYQLTRRVQYDDLFYQPARVGRWRLENAPVESTAADTLLAYDDFGRRSRIAAPGDSLDAPTQRFTYEPGAPVSRIVVQGRSQSGEAPDLETVQCVDGLGRTVQSRTRLEGGLYQVTGFHEVNPQGAPVRLYQPYQGGRDCEGGVPQDILFTSTFYDAAGRPLRVTLPDEALYGAASEATFDYSPLVTTRFDPDDNNPDNPITYNTPRRQTVDGLGRLISLERFLLAEGESGRVRALYDELGYMAGYLDPAQHRKQQVHDLLGRVLEVDDPNAGRTSFEYDAAGNLLARTDARGKTVQTRYDGANRPTERFDPEDESATLVRRLYDFAQDCEACTHAEGQLVRALYPLDVAGEVGSDAFGFDLREQPIILARTLEGHRFAIRTRFDNAGRILSTRYPDGTLLERHYDKASRLIGIDEVLDDVDYDPRGELRTLHYHNGVSTTYDYDERQRLSKLETRDSEQRLLQGYAYSRDRVGNFTSLSDLRTEGSLPVDYGVRYEHDAWYRMTGAYFEASDEALDFRFDLLDNLTRKASSLGSASAAHLGDYRYNVRRPNAVAQAGALTFEYDEAGRLTGRRGTTLSWDYQGRLVQANTDDGQQSRYVYGLGADRVLERHHGGTTYYVGPNFEVRDGLAITYARLGRQRLARLTSEEIATDLLQDSNGNQRLDVGDAWQILGTDTEPPPIGHLRGCARRMLAQADGDTVWLHRNRLRSLTLSTDQQGKLRGERAFYPTGQLRAERGFVDDYGFTGQRRDATAGLLHFSFRELDDVSGRWVSPDPLFELSTPSGIAQPGQSTTAYAYVAGALASGTDPTGLFLRRVGRALRAVTRRFRRRPRTAAASTPEAIPVVTAAAVAVAEAGAATAVAEVLEVEQFYTYRGDYMGPEEVFNRGRPSVSQTPMDVLEHANPSPNTRSYYRGTTTSWDTALTYAQGTERRQGGYIYQIRPRNGVDVRAEARRRGVGDFGESEIAIPGGILAQDVVGAWDLVNQSQWIANPNFVF